jgi:hypothetical protein
MKDRLTHISFRISRGDLKFVTQAAEKEQRSIGYILRRAVGHYVKGEAGYNRRPR